MSSDTHRLVLGLQPVREAIRIHRGRLTRVVVEARNTPKLEALARFAMDQGITNVDRADRFQMDRIAGGVEHQGVICWAPPLEFVGLPELLGDPKLLAVALDEIQDTQNFGAVVRCAVAIANAAIIWGEHASAPLTPATFRASAGAIEQAKLCRVRSLREALQELSASGVHVIGLDAHAPQAIDEHPLREPTVLVMGGEHRGLGRAIKASCTGTAHLLSSGKLDSLNVSVATGIALHAAVAARR